MHPLTPEQEQRARERAAAMLAESPQAVDASLADCTDRELEESERRSLRAANLLAKRQRDAEKRAELEAEAAKHQAQMMPNWKHTSSRRVPHSRAAPPTLTGSGRRSRINGCSTR